MENTPRFNSTLVRLNPVRVHGFAVHYIKFQFHTGTIKPFTYTVFKGHILWFQFHTGTIKPNMNLPDNIDREMVSIPHWYD